jgi:hypothetical protein
MHYKKAIGITIFTLCLALTGFPPKSFSQNSPAVQAETPATIVCPQCGFVNQWMNKFCIQCGRSLETAKNGVLESLKKPSDAARIDPEKPMPVESETPIEKLKPVREAALSPETKNETDAEAPRERWYTRILSEQGDIPRLFNIPTANMLRSLDLSFTGGGAFGIEKDRGFLGSISMGLGDIAEIQIVTQSVINALKNGSNVLPTSAFKLRLIGEGRLIPGVAAAIRSTTGWRKLEGEKTGISLETRLTKLYIVGTKQVGTVALHAGISLTDVRVRTPMGWTFLDATQSELQKNLWTPFGGISARANPKTYIMAEIEGQPSYDFEAGRIYGEGAIKNIWASVLGVRFYFTNWLAMDTGVRYRSDFHGIADATIQASFNGILPLGRASRKQAE